eukprot:scaffold181088_cov17-Tisochrysis_lutea.AAC.1
MLLLLEHATLSLRKATPVHVIRFCQKSCSRDCVHEHAFTGIGVRSWICNQRPRSAGKGIRLKSTSIAKKSLDWTDTRLNGAPTSGALRVVN